MAPTLAQASLTCSSWCILSTGQRDLPTSLSPASMASRSTPWPTRSSSRLRPTSRLMRLSLGGAKRRSRGIIILSARKEIENFHQKLLYPWPSCLVVHHHSEHHLTFIQIC